VNGIGANSAELEAVRDAVIEELRAELARLKAAVLAAARGLRRDRESACG
jgi:hypothetical protein